MVERNIASQEPEYRNYIEVNMFEWKTGRPGDLLHTGGLGPCIGLVVYDSKHKKAGMGHYPYVSGNSAEIKKDLKKFLAKSHIEDIKAYLRGGHLFQDEDVRTHREAILNILTGLGLNNEQIDVFWTEYPDDNVEMSFYPGNGRFEYEIHNDYD